MVTLDGESFHLDCKFIGLGVLRAMTCNCKIATGILAQNTNQV